MSMDTTRIDNAEALIGLFGSWPSFHDAEIHRIRLDRGVAVPPSLEADIHVFDMTSDVTPDGHFALKNHTIVTMHFGGVDQLELNSFNHENVLFGLTLNDISERKEDLSWEVEFDATFGVAARFLCERISVLLSLIHI